MLRAWTSRMRRSPGHRKEGGHPQGAELAVFLEDGLLEASVEARQRASHVVGERDRGEVDGEDLEAPGAGEEVGAEPHEDRVEGLLYLTRGAGRGEIDVEDAQL